MIDRTLTKWLGLGSAAVPLGLLAAAASIGAWWSAAPRRILWILTLALAPLLPLGGYLFGGSESATGYVGAVIGDPLRRTTGWLGAWVLFITGVVLTSIAAFRFNPLGPPALAVGAASRGAGRGARRAGAATREWWAQRAERRSETLARKEARRKAAADKTRALRLPFGGADAKNGAEDPGGRNVGLDGAVEGDPGTGDTGEGDSWVVQPTEGYVGVEQPAGVEHPGGEGQPEVGLEAQATKGTRRAASGAGSTPRSQPVPAGEDPSIENPRPAYSLLTAPTHENRFGMDQETRPAGSSPRQHAPDLQRQLRDFGAYDGPGGYAVRGGSRCRGKGQQDRQPGR